MSGAGVMSRAIPFTQAHVRRAEVPRWLSLRCGHRVAIDAGRFRSDHSRLGTRSAHVAGQGDGARARSLPQREGAKLVPPPTADDPYEDEAYRLWALKQQGR